MQAQARRRTNKERPAFKARVDYLLSGKIICGHCNQAMGGHTVTPRKKTYTYYGCLSKERVPGKSCQQKQISKELVEEAVINKIKSEILTPDTFAIIADKLRKNFSTHKDTIDEEISKKQALLIQAERKRKNLYKLVENGIDDNYTFEQIKVTKDTIDTLTAQIANLKKTKRSKILSDEEIQTAFQLFDTKLSSMDDLTAKKLLINLFLDKVVVTDKQIDIKLTTDAISNMLTK